MNSKLNFVLLLILGLFLAAILSRDGSLALMAIPFLTYTGVGLLSSPKSIKLTASRVLGSVRCKQDQPVAVSLNIQNMGETIYRLHVYDDLDPNQILVEGINNQSVMLGKDQTFRLQYVYRSPRGRYSWNDIKAKVSDPFGLFEKTISLSAPASILVLPEPSTIKRFRIRPKNTLRTAGSNLSRLPGRGIDFWGIREFHQGDPLRLINWRLTARHPQQFFSKEFEREEMASISLLLDARAATNLTTGKGNLFEYSVNVTAALAKNLLRAGNCVSLFAVGDRISRTFPGYGRRQLVKILDRLAACKPAERDTIDPFQYIPARMFPSQSLIIVISPLRLNDYHMIKQFRATGYQVMVISPNPISFINKHFSNDDTNHFAIRAVRIERELLIWKIRQLGVDLVDWHVDQPLEKSTRINHES